MEKTVADFFAGIGLVRFALQQTGWSEVYALDYSAEKRSLYQSHFANADYQLADIATVNGSDIPTITLAHASFPCTNTSVAGNRVGLAGTESAAFWQFVRVLGEMRDRKPALVLLENVEGLLITRKGDDLYLVLKALAELGYSLDLMLIDAAHFVPQSRVRLFIVGHQAGKRQDVLDQCTASQAVSAARPPKLAHFIQKHPDLPWSLRSLPPLPTRTTTLVDFIDQDEPWWSRTRSDYLFGQMHRYHQVYVEQMLHLDRWLYGTVFRRMRKRDGQQQSTAELRTDGIAGCLRTPKGGSARQILFRFGRGTFDARLLTGRECARLMGADTYYLADNVSLNQALFGFGDAVCVPVIDWIAQNYLNPVIEEISQDVLIEAA